MKSISIRKVGGGQPRQYLVSDDTAEKVVALIQTDEERQAGKSQELDVNEFTAKACNFYKVKPESLFQRCRKREIVLARQAIMFHLMKAHRYTTTNAGLYFNLDHATAIHARKRVSQGNIYNKILTA